MDHPPVWKYGNKFGENKGIPLKANANVRQVD